MLELFYMIIYDFELLKYYYFNLGL